MSRKIVSILALLCFLAVSNFAMGYSWTPVVVFQHNVDSNWFNPANYDDANIAPPDVNTNTIVEPKGTVIIDGDATCSVLQVAYWSWSSGPDVTVTLNSGTLNAGEAVNLATGDDYGNYGGFNASGDPNTVGTAILRVNSGTVTTPRAGAANTGLRIGGGGSAYAINTGRVIMYGGLISVPRIYLQHGDIALWGGTLELKNASGDTSADTNFVFFQNWPTNKIDISGGTLRLYGDHVAELNTLISNGRVYSARGVLGAPTFDSGAGYTTITSTANNLATAWNPSPAKSATNVHYKSTNSVTLSWNAGEPNVTTHNVYFGLASNSLVLKGTRIDANEPRTWEINDVAFAIGTTYYWRVDENSVTASNDDGSPKTFTMTTGQIWSFTTHDGKAYNFKPVNGGTGLSEPLQLSWTAGDFAASHQVFFGTTSPVALNTADAVVYRGAQSGTAYDIKKLSPNFTLVPGTTYYWRVREVNTASGSGGPWSSDTMSFTPGNYVTVDDFEDYNTMADVNVNWDTKYATSCGEFSENGTIKLITDASTRHLTLNYRDASYGQNNRFTEIRRSYTNGTSFTGSGALSPAPAALSIDYIGATTNSVDEIYDRMYVALQDTAGNIGIWKNPDGNAARLNTWQTKMVSLSDISAASTPNVKLTDVSALFIGFGQRCMVGGTGGDGNVMFDNIRLWAKTCNPDFAQANGLIADLDRDCDVDINDLDVFADYWLNHGEERVFANLTPSIIIQQPSAPVLWYKFDDSSADVIDYGTHPSDPNVYTGTVVRFAPINWSASAGRNASTHPACLYLPQGTNSYVRVPVGQLSFLGDSMHNTADGGGISFSVWINHDMTQVTDWTGLFGVWDNTTSDAAGELLEMHVPTPFGPTNTWGPSSNFVMKNHNRTATHNATASPGKRPEQDFGGRWNHWAFVKSPNHMLVYINGLLTADTNAVGPGPNEPNVYGPLFVYGSIQDFKVGTRGDNWGQWAGYIQDFQVYDYPLSDAEVAYLASDGTGSLTLPLISKANIVTPGAVGDQTVNFADLAKICEQWHQQILWP